MLLLTLLACSLSQVGQSVLENAASRWGYQADEAVVGEARVHYLDTGPRHGGTPLLLLHGFGGDGLGTWRAQMMPFSASRRVLVPDLVWFGRSQGGPTTLDGQVAAMLATLDDAGVQKADVMGISYGGFVALQLYRAAPERVGRLIIVDSPGPFFTEADETAMLGRFGVARTEELFLPDSPEEVQKLIQLTSYEPISIPRPVLADLQTNMFSDHVEEKRSLLADLRARRGSTTIAADPSRPRPLVIWGDHDEVFPVDKGQALAAALDARLVVIPETAHGPMAEKPREFNAAVLEYLDGP